MIKKSQRVEINNGMEIGGDKFVVIAGPCAVESEKTTLEIAGRLKEIAKILDISLIFKASFDKGNRTSHSSFRSIGFKPALDILAKVKTEYGLPILTDIHEPWQVDPVSKVVDILQIPAFLSRQTDLVQMAGKSGLPVNIKRGQFLSPEDMRFPVEKVRSVGQENVLITERGVSFGYNNLVVDMRAIPIMRKFAPVIFDATHSVQLPGKGDGVSLGQSQFVPYLAKAAAAVGVDGLFIETHPAPLTALSDGANMVPLDQLADLLGDVHAFWQLSRAQVKNE